jgi:hypothetical protein
MSTYGPQLSIRAPGYDDFAFAQMMPTFPVKSISVDVLDACYTLPGFGRSLMSILTSAHAPTFPVRDEEPRISYSEDGIPDCLVSFGP